MEMESKDRRGMVMLDEPGIAGVVIRTLHAKPAGISPGTGSEARKAVHAETDKV